MMTYLRKGIIANFYNAGVAAGGPAANAQTFTAGDLYIGINSNSGKAYSGDINEEIYYNTNLGTTDRQIVECYLSAKYGLTVGSICP